VGFRNQVAVAPTAAVYGDACLSQSGRAFDIGVCVDSHGHGAIHRAVAELPSNKGATRNTGPHCNKRMQMELKIG
jgi:hypothetical protein